MVRERGDRQRDRTRTTPASVPSDIATLVAMRDPDVSGDEVRNARRNIGSKADHHRIGGNFRASPGIRPSPGVAAFATGCGTAPVDDRRVRSSGTPIG